MRISLDSSEEIDKELLIHDVISSLTIMYCQ